MCVSVRLAVDVEQLPKLFKGKGVPASLPQAVQPATDCSVSGFLFLETKEQTLEPHTSFHKAGKF